jgi:parallel beta-helix repeat protein
LTLSNNEVFGNSSHGIRLEGTGTHTISGSRIFANFGDGIETHSSVNVTVSGSEIFGNVGYGLRSYSGGSSTATGNWWGAADGPSGEGAGAGDEVSTNVTYDPYLTDGTEFSYFDAGGSNHYGYGITQPAVSGTPSTEWGEDPVWSFLYNIGEKQITAEYIGLSTTSSYRLLVTYLNKDTDGGIQSLTELNNNGVIHPAWVLPTANPVQIAFPVGRAAIVDGSLRLSFNGLSGLRTVVSGIFLMKKVSPDNIPPVVHLNTPSNGQKLQGEGLSISGTVSDGQSGVLAVEIGIQKTGEILEWHPATSVTSTGDWSYLWSDPADGEYTLKAKATDRSGNSASAPEEPVVLVDGLAPAPATGLFAQGLSGVSGTIRLSWVLSGDDGTGADDVVRYEIYRSQERFTDYGLVGQVGPGVAQFDDSTVTGGEDYFYYARTVDQAGNSSDSSIAGPAQSTGAADDTPPEDVTDLTAAVTQVSGASPSVLLTWTGSANTEGDLVDQRLYISRDGFSFGNNNPTYDNGLSYSVGRDARSYQEGSLTVGETYTFKITTIDEVPNESSGTHVTVTPTGAETEVVTLSGTLSENTSLAAGTYVISASLTVPAEMSLTLQPGTIVKFASGGYLIVQGTLNALGTGGDPIVFTAYTDDSYGGDTNGDDASAGTPGYWDRIQFSNTSSSRLEHVVVRYGGYSNNGSIYMYYSDVGVLFSEISQGLSYGIYTHYSSPLLEQNTIANNGGSGIYHYQSSSPVDRNNTITGNEYGIYVQYATPTIDGNTITNNANHGIYYYDARNAPIITNNTITDNLIPILVPASSIPDETNVLTPNIRKYIGIRGNDIRNDKRLRVWGQGTPDEINTYVVYSGSITVPIYTFLTIDPGVVVKFFPGLGLIVNGALVATGSLDEKIVFTSDKDDAYGGDTNNDGSNSIPINGDWSGITFYDSFFEDSSHLNHVKVRYGGGNGSGGIYLYQADILVENSEISNSSSNGIRIIGASPTVTGSSIWGNSGDGINVGSSSNAEITFNSISTNFSDGIEIASGANATATNNQIFMNREYGLRNQSSNLIDATQTWWGDADGSGPYHATSNPTGTGNQVGDNVTYDPYQTTVATEFSYRNFSADAGSTYGDMSPPDLIQGTLSDAWDPANRRPDRTMVYDDLVVIVDYTGLESTKPYKLRLSYFNGDPGGSIQSLTDGNDNPIHGSLVMPTSAPVQYEFSIPSSYYADGNLRLKFVHDNPATSIRAAVPEVWLMEDIPELSPPRFEAVEYNDVDGSGSLTEGDEFYFHFSEEMDTSLLVDGTTDANDRLVPEGGGIYGTVNQSRWTADNKTVVVTLTTGFTVIGTEAVTPNGLTDLSGNAAIGSQNLTATDTIAPKFTGLEWLDTDTSGSISLGDQYVFHFNEAMDVSLIQDGTQDANVHLRPAGGLRYGDVNTVSYHHRRVYSAWGRTGHTEQFCDRRGREPGDRQPVSPWPGQHSSRIRRSSF